MATDQGVIDSVAMDNLKCVASQPASLANLALANAVSFQQAANAALLSQQTAASQLTQAIVGRVVGEIISTAMQEAAADVKTGTGNDLASSISSLLAAVASGQQQVKAAQTTPPPTS